MWRIGFDAPVCSTIYLDRSTPNHTPMQTIARANRVFEHPCLGSKVNCLIVDYAGNVETFFNELLTLAQQLNTEVLYRASGYATGCRGYSIILSYTP
ncbi:MAG: hypothetical protein JXA33_25000, partial [Anaerolineae bacterium]|nr:hypothetical protein [Anaerolineae bacterium]